MFKYSVILEDGTWVDREPVVGEVVYRYDYTGVRVGPFVYEEEPPVEPERRRVITTRSLWRRVTEEKYAQLIGMSKDNDLLAARLKMINGDKIVDLDDAQLVLGFTELQQAGFFTEEDQARIFADAQDGEV